MKRETFMVGIPPWNPRGSAEITASPWLVLSSIMDTASTSHGWSVSSGTVGALAPCVPPLLAGAARWPWRGEREGRLAPML